MRARALTLGLFVVGFGGCKAEPDFVATTTPPSCDVRSQLVRRGYPENLDQILIPGNCTATRTPGMRGPDFTWWLAGAQTPWGDCTSTQFEPMFWTESNADGVITKVHFCPEFCEGLREQLFEELDKDVACQRDSGVPHEAGAPADPNAPVFPVPNGGFSGGVAGAGAGGSTGGATAGAAGTAGLAAGAGGGLAAGAGGVAAGAAGAAAGVGGSAAGAGGVAAGAGGVAAGAGGVAAGAGGVAAGAGGVAAGSAGAVAGSGGRGP